MAYTLKMRLWRGDQSGGDLQDYDVEVESGEGVELTEKPLPEMPDELKKYFDS